jgi:hypothetical protein
MNDRDVAGGSSTGTHLIQQIVVGAARDAIFPCIATHCGHGTASRHSVRILIRETQRVLG